jgi:hypothetical protein
MLTVGYALRRCRSASQSTPPRYVPKRSTTLYVKDVQNTIASIHVCMLESVYKAERSV